MRWLVGIIALLAACPSTSARTWYVDAAIGNDLQTGLAARPDDRDGPLATINAALWYAGPGDRIELAAGQIFREMISLSGRCLQGEPDRPFVIAGNGSILDGTVVGDQGSWQPLEGDTFALSPRRLAYQQLFSAGRPLQRVQLESLVAVDSALEPLQWALVEQRIVFKVEPDKLPMDYALRHCGMETGITLYNVRHIRIENLTVQGFHTDGINAHELVRDCTLAGVECRANGRSGLSVGGVSRVAVVGGHFYDNGRVQIRTEVQGELTISGAEVDDATAPSFSSAGGKLLVDGKETFAP